VGNYFKTGGTAVNLRIMNCPVLLLAWLSLSQGCFASGDDRFRAGVAAYEAGQYEPAAQAFRDSLAGQATAGTLINLGLADWQCGRTGGSILAWEQAAWLDPFDHAAANNLLYAREAASVNPLELTWFEEASTWLPANWWTWLAGGSLWLAVALVTLPGFFRMRNADWHQTVSALSLGVFLLSLAPSIGIVTRSKIGIVVENNTMLRLTPTQSAESIASLPPGEPVRTLRQRGNFLFIHAQSGNGWVERRQIGLLVPD
jgi:tetratricopeptide (TPR) repeat protein